MADTDDMLTNIIIAFAVVCFVLFVIIVFLCVAIGFIISKLKQHEQSITALEDRERSYLQTQKEPKIENMSNKGHVDVNEIHLRRQNRPRSSEGNEVDMRPRPKLSNNFRMTVLIEQETVNVYGNKAPTGQLISIAQKYYKEENNTETDIPAESVEILDKVSNQREAKSKIFSDDWMDGGVPTSLLFSGAAQSTQNVNFPNVVTQNKGIFIHKTIGREGGELTISGVKLTFPPNAITEPKLISVGILWDENFIPHMHKKQTLLSPIVLCQPSGLQFDKPVVLSFPHAAVDVENNWNVNVLKREGNLTDNIDWSQISQADYDEWSINPGRIELKLKHFTLYTCLGESKCGHVAKKVIQVVAFAGTLTQAEYFKPRIYCLNNYKEEIGDVKTLEKDLDDQSKIRETSTLIVHDNDQDVMVELADMLEGWKVLGNKVECIQFEQVWNKMQPHCSFILEPVKKVSEIRCEYHIYQNGRENFAAKLKIAEKMATSKMILQEEDPHRELLNELIVLLDPENIAGSDAGNWRDLAEKMGCGLARIRWLKCQKSPTKVLFRKWMNEEKRTLVELEQLLRDINRPDAADEVRLRVNSSELHQTIPNNSTSI